MGKEENPVSAFDRTNKESMSISWTGGVQLAIDVRQHRLLSDQPLEDGGQDQGITPVEMLVASLGACIGYYALRFCQRHKIPTDGLKIVMQWTYAEQPHRIGAMTARVDLPGEWNPAMKDRLLKVLEGCTVHQTLTHPPEISVQLAT
jgi:putative redox protein